MKRKRIVSVSDIVYAALIVAASLLIWFFALPKEQGASVVFRVDGAEVAALPLTEDAVYEIDGAYHNVFEIENGAVRVTYTDCPGHQCEKSGAVSAAGQSIVCAPNHVSATIQSAGPGVDAITE